MSRKRIAVLLGSVGIGLGSAAAAAALAGVGGPSATNYILLFSAIVAGVGGVVSAVLTVVGNTGTATEQRRLATGQEAMAQDIKLLAELTQTSLDEAKAQRPNPTVEFLLRDGTSAPAAEWSREVDARTVDVEAIIEAERRRALATLPPPRSTARGDTMAEQLQQSLLAFQLLANGLISDDDRAKFEATVEDYLERLRQWLTAFESWRAVRSRILAVAFRVSNNGRAPAIDVRVHLHFPSEFQSIEEAPSISAPPGRPRFRQGGMFDFSMSSLGLGRPGALRMPNITPINQNVTGPYYSDGSLLVEFKIKKLLHGILEDTKDPALLLFDAEGTYPVPWEIHADNIAEPATGELAIKVVSKVTTEPSIATLDDVITCLPPAMRSHLEEG